MRVYLDLVMGLNFAVDLLLLLGTNRLAGFSSEGKRVIGAAALGSVYSGACLLQGFRFLGSTLWRTVTGVQTCALPICRKSAPVRSTSQRFSPQGWAFFITRMSLS